MTMQTPAQTAPAAGLPQPTSITTVGADGKPQTIAIPKTQAEVDALVRRRNELSDQLNSVTNRRQQLVNQIRSAPDGVARTGLEDRVKVLDQRLLQLEADLSSTGEQLASSPADLVRRSEERSVSRPGQACLRRSHSNHERALVVEHHRPAGAAHHRSAQARDVQRNLGVNVEVDILHLHRRDGIGWRGHGRFRLRVPGRRLNRSGADRKGN